MVIRLLAPGEPHPFEVVATPGRRILDQFVDHATGYLVVRELDDGDRWIHYTLVDAKSGAIISPQRRAAELPAGEQRREVHPGLRLDTLHTLDPKTGAETLRETLTDEKTGAVVAERRSSPLAASPGKTLVEVYLAQRAETQRAETFWKTDYPQKTLEERQTYWLENVLGYMRQQGESGLDEYGLFTPERYAEWRASEPQIDRILDFVIEHIPDDSATVRAEIDRRLRRP